MRTRPAAGAAISIAAFSVSISSTGSSASTGAPSSLSHCTITPSVTDSPSCGMRISDAMAQAASACSRIAFSSAWCT
jgi:hypothetical protein